MVKFSYSKQGIWYTLSHKNEVVKHLFRLGSTTKDGMTIYEIIVWKIAIQWSME